jgi:hypothetical protein
MRFGRGLDGDVDDFVDLMAKQVSQMDEWTRALQNVSRLDESLLFSQVSATETEWNRERERDVIIVFHIDTIC